MKKHISNILLYLILIIGLSLLLYPTISDWWNSFHSSRAISTYSEDVSKLDDDHYDEIWNAAWEYNQSLLTQPNTYVLSDEMIAQYNELLNLNNSGVMGYIEIPSLNVALPIYHGTDEAILQVAVGHLEWTSLPVGGESSHSVVSGHRGLPSARLFSDLDKMVIGDIFQLRILEEVLTYEVDQIRIVEPQELEELMIEEGEDLCTLVTCTPYGINSHRLLVRGHRVDNPEEVKVARVGADALLIEPLLVAPFVAAPILIFLLIMVVLPKKK